MGKGFNHGGEKHDDIFLLKRFLSTAEVGFQIGDALLHLNVALLVGVDTATHFLEDEATSVFNNVGMRILLNLRQKLNLLPEDELSLLIVQPDLLDTFDVALLINNFIYNAIARSDHVADLKSLIELTIST